MVNHKKRMQYLKTQISTASREQLVLMLMDGVIRFCEQGKLAIAEKDYEASHEALMRAQAIVMELFYGLDQENGGEIAENLTRLYTYSFQILIEANMTREVEKIEETQRIFRELREGWTGAMEALKEEGNLPGQPAKDASNADTESVNVTLSQETEEAPKPAPPMPKRPPRPETATAPRLSVQG